MNRRRTLTAIVLTAALTMAAVVGTGSATAANSSADETTPPAAPIDVEVTDIGWQQVTVTWEHGSNDTPWMYRIDNLTNGDVKTVAGTSTRAQLIGLDPDQTYRLQVKAIDVYVSSEPVEVTATTVAMPHVEPPSDLEVVSVAWNGVDLAWEPSPEADLRAYEIVYLDRRDGYFEAVDASQTTAHLELRPERTYRFAVRAAKKHIDFQQVHSELTNEVTVTTPEQTIEPPTNLRADRDGRSVTLTWLPPDHLDLPTAEVEYLVYDGDRLETIVLGGRGGARTRTQTIPRISGGDHEYTVRARYRFHGSALSPPSNPAVVTGPVSDDSTPPDPPSRLRNIVDCNTGEHDYILEGASDDTSSLDSIRYQRIRTDLRTGMSYVLPGSFDLPRSGSLRLLSPFPPWGQGLPFRAVDEVGNRSEIVELPLEEEEFVGC